MSGTDISFARGGEARDGVEGRCYGRCVQQRVGCCLGRLGTNQVRSRQDGVCVQRGEEKGEKHRGEEKPREFVSEEGRSQERRGDTEE